MNRTGTLSSMPADLKQEPVHPPRSFTKASTDEWIKTSRVAIVSKSSCPFCWQVKGAFEECINDSSVKLKKRDVSIWEIDYDPSMAEIQDYMRNMTGGRSVPRVFINGNFI